MNLLTDPWIPILRRSGMLEKIAPWQIVETEDPVIKLASPRHDFDGALIQFLIGLLQTTCAPEGHNNWVKWLEIMPSPDELKLKFDVYKNTFEVNGDKTCFMQDFNTFEGDPKPVSGLLIEAPGARTTNLFLDHFIKDGAYQGFCDCCTVTALFALQTNAPSGGVGHRTSLRGGGPLTTLIIPDTRVKNALPDNLWTTIWLNILDQKSMLHLSGNGELEKKENIFPWLNKTITSEAKTGKATTPEQAHPLQMYWAMPRRIRIDWQNGESGVCDICGEKSESLITHYVTKNYGANYTSGWQHPLSPHYEAKKTHEKLPLHAQPGGLVYRHWLGWTHQSEQNFPAKIVDVYLNEKGRRLDTEQIRLWVFGYDMDNMKARCWYEKHYPLFILEDENMRICFFKRISEAITLATQIAGFVQSCIKEAWFDRPKDARGDTHFLKEAFFEQTESSFLLMMNEMRKSVVLEKEKEVLQQWHSELAHQALRLFDHWAAKGDIEYGNPKRIAEAHRKLRNLINGKKMLGAVGLAKKNSGKNKSKEKIA